MIGTAAQPERLGPYRITGQLGKGGMGVVFRAEHVETGQAAAVKTVRLAFGTQLAGLRCEIHALTRIRHPGVVRILDEGIHGGLPWYAMELLHGHTLDDHTRSLWNRASARLGTGGSTSSNDLTFTATIAVGAGADREDPRIDPLHGTLAAGAAAAAVTGGETPPVDEPAPPGWRLPAAGGELAEMLSIIRRLCAPLAFIHGSGIVHRDLKPSNVFIRDDGTPVLFDFGVIANSQGGVEGRDRIEVSGNVIGTASYIAPEQIKGHLVDARADLYSLGCMLYEIVTGRPPFVGLSPLQVIAQHLAQPPAPPSRLAEGVDPDLERLILRLLAKTPRDRLGHADDLAQALAAIGGVAGERVVVPAELLPRAYLYRPEIAGRDQVLEEFRQRITRAAGASGGLCLIGGESGVGKTCLATAVAHEAVIHGLSVVTGECLPLALRDAGGITEMKGAPLHPFHRLLETIADHCREKGAVVTCRLLGARGKLLAAYEPSLRDLPGQDAYPEPPEVPAQAARLRILVALRDTVAAFAGEKPLLLIVDDLQWADELSLGFLSLLDAPFFEGKRLLVAGTYRSEELSDGLREVLSLPGVEAVTLPRLDEGTVGRIVGDMLAMPAPPPAFVRVLSRRSSGNPFFVAEYLRAAVADNLLFREGGTWQVAGAAEDSEALYEALPLPLSLRDLVGRRLGGLSPDARRLVEVAVVLGREVDGAVLMAVAGLDDPRALPAMKQLLLCQVLDEVQPGRFRFVHDKLREIAYDHIDPARRGDLHREAARAIEARYQGGGAFPRHYSQLAHHYGQAEDLPRAVDYLDLAAGQAEKNFANREAVTFLTDALALEERSSARVPALRRAAWERRLGNAHLGLGKLVDSQDHLLRAVALLRQPMPRATWRVVAGFVGQALRQLAHRLRAPRLAPPGDLREVLLEAARAYDLLMPVSYFVTGQLVRILYATLANLNLSERAGPSPELALAYGNAHHTAGLIPWESLAQSYGRRARQLLQTVSDPSVVSWVYITIGAHAIVVAAWDDALDAGERSRVIAEEVGFRRRVEEAQGVLGSAWCLHGDWEKARDASQRTWDSGRRGDAQSIVWGASGVAQACIQLGEMARGLPAAEAGARSAENLERPERILALGVLSLALLRSGEASRALEVARRAAAVIAQGTPAFFYCIHAYSCVAEVFLDLLESPPLAAVAGGRQALLRDARRSVHHVEQSAKIFPVHRARALLLRGRLEALAGRADQARSLYRRSFDEARRSDLRHDAALAQLHTALTLERGAPERGDAMARARETFAAMKSSFELRRVDAG